MSDESILKGKEEGKDVKSSMTIQPADVEEVEAKLSPKPGQKKTPGRKVAVKTKVITDLSPPKKSRDKNVDIPESVKRDGKRVSLDRLLIKKKEETQDFFLMRSSYAKVAAQLFPKENSATHVLLGELGANRGKYGLTYSEEIEKVLLYIDENILNL